VNRNMNSNDPDLKLAGSMFTNSQSVPMSWFVIHPEFRNEPRIKWEELEGVANKRSTEQN